MHWHRGHSHSGRATGDPLGHRCTHEATASPTPATHFVSCNSPCNGYTSCNADNPMLHRRWALLFILWWRASQDTDWPLHTKTQATKCISRPPHITATIGVPSFPLRIESLEPHAPMPKTTSTTPDRGRATQMISSWSPPPLPAPTIMHRPLYYYGIGQASRTSRVPRWRNGNQRIGLVSELVGGAATWSPPPSPARRLKISSVLYLENDGWVTDSGEQDPPSSASPSCGPWVRGPLQAVGMAKR